MQRRKFYVYIQTERQRETYCTYRFPTDGVVNIWRYLQNWFCGTVAVVCKTPSVAEGRRIALCSAHYNEAKQKKGGGEREKSAKFPNANVIALFCCLYLYYMYMYVFIQNHVQNTSLLLYIDVARFDAIFNIFLSYSLFLVFLFFWSRQICDENERRVRRRTTHTEKKVNLLLWLWLRLRRAPFFSVPSKIHFVGVGVLLAAAVGAASISIHW